MNHNDRRHLFRVIEGGGDLPPEFRGPVSRLGLTPPQPVPARLIALLIFSKLAMLAGAAYFIWG